MTSPARLAKGTPVWCAPYPDDPTVELPAIVERVNRKSVAVRFGQGCNPFGNDVNRTLVPFDRVYRREVGDA